MKSIFKKIAVAALSLVCACATIPTGLHEVKAADSKEMVAIHVQAPADWKQPCLWAWNQDGTNAFDAWPGDEMDADKDNAGWYYIYVPKFANHIIVNANEGGVQTEEVVLEEGKEAWVTVKDDKSTEVSYDAKTQGKLPEYVAKFAVHAKVDESWKEPCIWAWKAPDGTNVFEKWPGKKMSFNKDTGWYTAKVPEWVNSVIINGNEGGVQTQDLTIDPAEVWITVDKDGKAEFSYKDPAKAAAPNVKIHVKAPSDWAKPNLWAWSAPDGTNVYSTWPGEALEEGSDGWLEKEIPGWVNSVIVNGNDGSVQTKDISVETGKEIWLVVTGPEEFNVYYEKPETVETKAEDSTQADGQEKKNSNSAIPVAAGIGGAVVVIGGAAALIAKKKKAA